MSDDATKPNIKIDPDAFWRWLQVTDRIENLGDGELCDIIIEGVWAEMPMGSPQELLIDELIQRYEERQGIERDEKGIRIKKDGLAALKEAVSKARGGPTPPPMQTGFA